MARRLVNYCKQFQHWNSITVVQSIDQIVVNPQRNVVLIPEVKSIWALTCRQPGLNGWPVDCKYKYFSLTLSQLSYDGNNIMRSQCAYTGDAAHCDIKASFTQTLLPDYLSTCLWPHFYGYSYVGSVDETTASPADRLSITSILNRQCSYSLYTLAVPILWWNAVCCLGEWSNWLREGWRATKSEREGELRVSGAHIGSGCKHKMGIYDHHREVFILSMRGRKYMSVV